MAFPFLPGGAIVAAVVLLSAIAGFVAGMMAIDRAATRVFGGVVSGLVSGARRWHDDAAPLERHRSEELRPITTAVLDAVPSRDRSGSPIVADWDPAAPAAPSSVLVDEVVEPVDPLDRVRPRMR